MAIQNFNNPKGTKITSGKKLGKRNQTTKSNTPSQQQQYRPNQSMTGLTQSKWIKK